MNSLEISLKIESILRKISNKNAIYRDNISKEPYKTIYNVLESRLQNAADCFAFEYSQLEPYTLNELIEKEINIKDLINYLTKLIDEGD
jgi:hypothetical protein